MCQKTSMTHSDFALIWDKGVDTLVLSLIDEKVIFEQALPFASQASKAEKKKCKKLVEEFTKSSKVTLMPWLSA